MTSRRSAPGESKANIRREVRARILRLTDIFVADLAKLDHYKKTRVLRAFHEWEQTSIAVAIDPDWDADKFWDMASNEAPLADWLYKVTDSIDQHFVCRSKDCLSVIHNHHWLRQISRDSCPRCLTGYRPWAQRNNASSTNAPTFVPAQKALIINGDGMTTADLDTPTPAGHRLTSDGGDYMLYLMQWEKKDDDALVGKLKQIMAGLRRDYGTGERSVQTRRSTSR